MLENIGWIGATLLAFCAFFPALEAWKTKKTTMSWNFLIPWGVGEILVLIPIIFKVPEPWLIFNYVMNLLFIGVLVYYKVERK